MKNILILVACVAVVFLVCFHAYKQDSTCRNLGGVPIGQFSDCWIEGRGFVEVLE